jgi:hypothetical protein
MYRLAVLLIVACSHPAPVAKPECPPVPPVAKPEPAPAPPAAPPLSDADAIAQADAFFGAMDRNDAAAFETATATSFVQTLPQRKYDRAFLTNVIRGRADNKYPVRTRACTNHKVFRGDTAAVVATDCVMKFPAQEDVPAYETEQTNTVVLAVDRGAWKVALWTTHLLGIETDREMWNETFRQSLNFKKSANQHLIDAVKGRKPGKALDIEMGQGRNVLYLASQGWKVTGVDISDEGIKLAQAAAARQKLSFEAVREDINKYDFGTNKWDLVTMIYAGSNPQTIDRVKPSIKKGGLFVVEFFHKEATAGSGIGGFMTGELANQFGDGWTILKDEVVEDIADWGLRKTKLVRFTAQKK